MYLAAIILSSTMLFSCNSKKDDKKSESKSAIECKKDDKSSCCTKSIDGEWSLVKLNGKDINPADSIFLGFSAKDDYRVYGMTGCNRLMGQFKLDGDKLTLENLGSTKAMCHNDAIEREFLAALPEITTFKTECTETAETMTLFDKDKKEILVLTKKIKAADSDDKTKKEVKDTTKTKDDSKAKDETSKPNKKK